MAVLSKIRQRTGLLIVVIGFCLLAFLVGDAFQSGTFGSDSNDIGSVNGTDIQTQDFLQKVSMAEKQSQGISNTQAINNTWEQEVRSIILSEEFEKLGLQIGDEQFINIVKLNPNLAQNPQFLNAAGQFDENKFKESLNTFKIHYVITPEDYERSNQCEHMRRGHERRYKSGKVIWIDSYKAGKNNQEKKDE